MRRFVDESCVTDAPGRRGKRTNRARTVHRAAVVAIHGSVVEVSNADRYEEGRVRATSGGSRDVRHHLRLATAQVHASLHEHPGFVALLDGEATVELYRCLLSRLYGIYQPLEATLASADHHLPPGLRPQRRSRDALMAQDLMALGLDRHDLARLPRKGDVHPPTTLSEALGAVYVVQGSALGGKVLARALRQRSADPWSSCFFAGFADDRQAWERCCDALDQCTDDVGRLTAAAVATFQHIADWMAGWPNEHPANG
jgi:heme oxygenase